MSEDIFSSLQSGSSSKKFKRVPEPGESSVAAIVATCLVVAGVGFASVPQLKGMLQEGEAVNKSSEALFRVRQNPLRGVDKQRNEVAFEEGMPIYDASTMRRITKEGAFVANKSGDTAVIKNGVLSEVRRVNSTDSADFLAWLRRNETLRTRPGV